MRSPALHRGVELAGSAPAMRPWQVIALAAAISAVGLGIRIWNLGEQSLWVDEVYTHRIASLPLSGILSARPADKPPLDYYAVHLAMRVLGDTEWAMRVPSAIWGALTPLALGGLVGALFGRAAGFTALVALVFSPFHLRFSQEARPYALMMLSNAVAAWSLVEIRRRGRGHRGLWIIHGAASLVAVWTHFMSIVWLALLQIWCWGLWLRRRGAPAGEEALALARGAAIELALALITLVPLWLWIPHGESAGAEAPFNFVPREVLLDFNAFVFGAGHHEHVRHAGAVGVALAVLGGIWAWHRSREGASLLLLLCAGMWVTPLIFHWAIDHWIAPRYFTGGLLPLVALMALGVVAIAEGLGRVIPTRWGAAQRRTGLVLTALLTLHAALAGIWMIRNPHEKKDWRALVDWLGANRPAGQVVLVADPLHIDTLQHYAPRRGVAIVPELQPDPEMLRERAMALGDCSALLPWEITSGPLHAWLSGMGSDECPLEDFQVWRVRMDTE